MPKPVVLLIALLACCAAFFALVRPNRRAEVILPSVDPNGAPVHMPSTREAARSAAEAIPVILENAAACRDLGSEKYETWRVVGADLFDNRVFKTEDAAVDRSLALQQRLLDEARAAGGEASVAKVGRLFGAESALCSLVLNPRGSLLSFGAEQNRLISEFDIAGAQLRAELGALAFNAPLKPEYEAEISRQRKGA